MPWYDPEPVLSDQPKIKYSNCTLMNMVLLVTQDTLPCNRLEWSLTILSMYVRLLTTAKHE